MPPRAASADRNDGTTTSHHALHDGFAAALALGPQPKARGNYRPLPGSPFVNASSCGGAWQPNSNRHTNNVANEKGEQLEGDDEDDEDEGDHEEASEEVTQDTKAKGRARKPSAKVKSKGKAKANAKTASPMNASEQRKAHNRLAQRDFRQRKQQYIRALESRVELLSTSHDEQVDRLRFALRTLLGENTYLRGLVRSLSDFIGEDHIKGPLERCGITLDDLNETVEASSEATMLHSWRHYPKPTQSETIQELRKASNLPPEGLPESRILSTSPGARVPLRATSRKTAASLSEEGPQSGNAASGKRGSESLFVRQDDELSPATLQSADGAKRQRVDDDTTEASNIGVGENMASSLFGSSAMPPYSSMSTVDSPGLQNLLTFGLPNSNNATFDTDSRNLGSDNLLESLFGPTNNMMSGAQTPLGSFVAPSWGAKYPMVANAGDARTPAIQAIPSTLTAESSQAQIVNDEMLNEILKRMQTTIFQVNQVRKLLGRSDLFAPMPLQTNEPVAAPPPLSVKDLPSLLLFEHNGALTDSSSIDHQQRSERISEVLLTIHHYLSAYRKSPSYNLPPLLKPTEIQQSRPHDPFWDGLPFPGLRDKLIENSHRYNSDALTVQIFDHIRIHDGDLMQEATWELPISFFLRYPFLADERTLSTFNRWRTSRGEDALSVTDVYAMASTMAPPRLDGLVQEDDIVDKHDE